MSKRNPSNTIDPGNYNAIKHLEKVMSESGLDKLHYKLIKIRASQINGCAYCLNMHIREALKLGMNDQKLHLVSVWRETQLFTEEEKAILALTEEVTLIANHGVSDKVYDNAVEILGKAYTNIVILGIITINAWNRIAITDQLLPN
ncbi:carboxymuconolactone decarboxylase family protein [Dyadobacter luticola]|uniref:Carboxymuconolactone decarboxylase family protein n=1 Tax=Dyadobacter luticola TaxID=1979387 RepID=A0A5R9KRD7_9BACT|nr:carboxymuconolactone decarboxylase family protein [Dyadobacter luticola]TLU98851.1 carboxymuconolactone decarboxylase family protein [Dyadobacter luticola]